MFARITKDPRFDEGHALIIVNQAPAPGDNPNFSLRRASDQKFLGTDGMWHEAEQKIPVDNGVYKDKTFFIPVAPELLREFVSTETHFITCNGSDSIFFLVPPKLPDGVNPDEL